MNIINCSPLWNDYELIDSGDFYKLERFGKYILSRPEPQAVWSKSLPEKEWQNLCHAEFKKEKNAGADSEKGEWVQKPNMPGQWLVNYNYKDSNLKFRLGMTSFKHVGLFPEQAANWNYIIDSIGLLKIEKPKVLNLFAYTGGASIAAKSAGADVSHVDSVKQVVTWSRENMENSGLKDIRWVVEDAMKYVKREVKRGSTYHGIILDPPKYGRGPEGEKWILDDSINELIGLCKSLLNSEKNFFVLNLYSMGYSPIIAESLTKSHFPIQKEAEFGEFYFTDKAGRKLPLGIFYRFRNL